MATVCFYGDLQRYGRRFHLEVHTAGEALRALILQIPGLRQHISNDFYRLRIAGQDITQEELKQGMHSPLPDKAVIHLVPRALGAKNAGIFPTILGAVMVVVGAFTWQPGIIAAGVGMIATGVASMLTKMPQTAKAGDSNITNTAFSNLDNGIAQGAAIPLCYGEVRIGSKVLSQGLATE